MRKWFLVLFSITVQIAAQGISQPGFSAEGGSTVYAPGFYGDFGMADTGPAGLEITGMAYYQRATVSKTLKGGRLNTNLRESLYVFVPTITYVSDYTLFGGTYFAGARLAIAHNTADGVAEGTQPFQTERDHQFGIEDPYVYPLGLTWNVRNLHIAFFEGVNLPIGQYDRENRATLGSHYWASDTNLAFSWEDSNKGHEISFNLGYLINARNPATQYRTGQGVHLDYLVGQHFSNKVAVGIAGYIYRQMTGDSGRGALEGPFKLQVNGIGPAVMYRLEREQIDIDFTAKWLQDFGVSNGLSGTHLFFEVGFSF